MNSSNTRCDCVRIPFELSRYGETTVMEEKGKELAQRIEKHERRLGIWRN